MSSKQQCLNAIENMYKNIAVIDEFFHKSIHSPTTSDVFCLRSMIDNINCLLMNDKDVNK